MSDLKDALMEIDGVGEATAEKVLDVLAEHDDSNSEHIQNALDYLEAEKSHMAYEQLRAELG